MTIPEYLAATGTTQKALAERLGIARQYLYKICTGTIPRRDMRLKIIEATGGQVQEVDFFRHAERPAADAEQAAE